MMIKTIRLSFYSMLMVSLHIMDNGGAGIYSTLRQVQQSQIRHTGVL